MSSAMLPRMIGRFSAVPLSTPRLALLAQARALAPPAPGGPRRGLHTTHVPRSTTTLPNILAGGPAPPVVVKRMTDRGLQLADGLVIPGPCIFLEGEVLLWDVPDADKWATMTEKEVRERFEVFEVVVPRPEILLLGTGRSVAMPPPALRQYLNSIGIQVDVLDTWNACSTYNLLAEEGRRVAAALLPHTPHSWKPQTGTLH